MSSSNPKFEMRALIIIVPFAAAFLFGCLCICKHKVFLWTLKKDDTDSDAGPKIVQVKTDASKNGADKYEVPADPEAGNFRGAESESDSSFLADSGKGGQRKSFCA